MFSGESFPGLEKVQSINAYLGAFPIARALELGADIVVTGRCVDSAVTLGACIHAFGWGRDDLNQLAQGSLAGHILECGAQATGGNFTDWEQVPEMAKMGYPIAEVRADGSFVCTKPANTGGLVSVGTVSEQMLYEIGDPQAYMLPDVVCDFSTVRLRQLGADRVEVSSATGRPAPDSYKVSATYADQFRGGAYMTFYGNDADRKARVFGEAVLSAAATVFQQSGLPGFSETSIEILGAESQYGDFADIQGSREVVLKLAAKHMDSKGISIMLREAVGLALAGPPGLSGFAGGRPSPPRWYGCFPLPLIAPRRRCKWRSAGVCTLAMKRTVNRSMRAVSAERLRRWPNWREKRARFPWWRWPGAAAGIKATRPMSGSLPESPNFCRIFIMR